MRRCLKVLKAPKDDRFQVITERPAQNFIFDSSFLGIQRSKDCVIIQVTLNAGRTVDQKRAFYKTIADGLHKRLSLRRETCFIVWLKSPKRTGRLATVRRNSRNSFTEQETLYESCYVLGNAGKHFTCGQAVDRENIGRVEAVHANV